ncbi:hemerythrin domain-containing protein [Chitinimonas viridis]|uniref:Hemerythrin domain-containing protein n=1 Tax=Chitinimonas viridis TaxID=664880 RepID=A0ABT8B0W4_9NEIS|nr:hemerythrin domain-containing protein [Chitinimonas viridis]MDN3575360.1 hemerythrin domain-containing protein [Chitinimonas viridis]
MAAVSAITEPRLPIQTGGCHAFAIVAFPGYSHPHHYPDSPVSLANRGDLQLNSLDKTMTTTISNTSKLNSLKKAQDATVLLRADHTLVGGLFDEYEKKPSLAKKRQLVAQICAELSVHAQVEEEIFYPAVKRALHDKELVPEATVEHATLKALIAEVEGVEPTGEMFDAKMKVLGEYVKHHVKEEQNEMFPKAKATDIDMAELGAEIAERKKALFAQRS